MHERHHLIRLTEAGWQRVQDEAAAAGDARRQAVLAQWRQRQWPVVVRRADVDAGPDEICAGIALPPDAQGNKPRIALRVHADEVASQHAPVLLADIAAAPPAGVPAVWGERMPELQQHMARAGIALSVFGSLSWQVMTGQAYVRPSSDIDLLFVPASRAQLAEGVRLLAWQAMFLPLDGEIVFPGDAAVSWKEWRQVAVKGGDPDNKVLVKTPGAVKLERVGVLEASLPSQGEAPCAA